MSYPYSFQLYARLGWGPTAHTSTREHDKSVWFICCNTSSGSLYVVMKKNSKNKNLLLFLERERKISQKYNLRQHQSPYTLYSPKNS